jgi:hypothetical protein
MKVLNTLIKLLIMIILLADLSYSFIQHYNMPLDGDLAPIVAPSEQYEYILQDPFGIRVLTDGEKYANPNRFFAHWTVVNYFRTVPNLLQNFTSPINSVYLTCAIAKVVTQVMLLVLLAWYTTGFRRIWSFRFLLPAFLIFSLFQTTGYSRFMGIIDPSIVYAFAYAWPITLMLIFYIPVYRYLRWHKPFCLKIWWIVLLTLLAFFIALNGALIPALIIIINGLIFFRWIFFGSQSIAMRGNILRNSITSIKKMPGSLLYLLILSTILSIYSLILGTFNSESVVHQVSWIDFYSRLPQGLFTLISTKLGWPVLLAFIVANIIIMGRRESSMTKKQMMIFFRWLLVFSIIYLLLLPLGGYRWYRPNAIRYDTFIPVTIACIYIFATSSYYLLNELRSKHKLIYTFFIIGFILLFTISDNPNGGANSCEIEHLNKLASSEETPVVLSDECLLLSWRIITDPADSKDQAEVIYIWNITAERKRYYQVGK